ncbi:MAG: anthranilate synthase component I family protein [Bacteroidetes bacterium]|nr:anthranilate synthase component I family protein [Bacteroidota bacterium]
MKADLELPVRSLSQLRNQLAALAERESVSLLLGGHDFPDQYGKYLILLALGAEEIVEPSSGENAFDALERACRKDGWWFGHLSYDLKRATHGLESSNPAYIPWPDLFWFRPRIVFAVRRDEPHVLKVYGSRIPELPQEIVHTEAMRVPRFNPSQDPEAYRRSIETIKNDIRKGTYYELNHCLEFRGVYEDLNVAEAWQRLSEVAPAPFSAYYRCKDKVALCASPERFLARRGDMLISEPIKGTAPRGMDEASDQMAIQELSSDEKNRAENVMIVDLVRNDLSRACIPGSVHVPELCAIRSYAQVHQMTSVVCGQSLPGVSMAEHLKNTFPMGSMTGAPKHEVMQHIERYESFRRGLYSGTIGYMEPGGDFDFNVVIRTLQYEAHSGRIAYHTGGAITWDSRAMQEWEECSWKARGILKVFDSLS